MKKILLAPNSFKECADSETVTELLFKYLSGSSGFDFLRMPVSDGGDGFLGVCSKIFNTDIITSKVSTAYGGSSVEVKYAYSRERKQVFIESAEVIGMKRIPLEKRHPLLLNSKGLGELVKQVAGSELNVDKVTIGVGGTGTTDLGLGFCSQFGLELYDVSGQKVSVLPANFHRVDRINWSDPGLPFGFELIVDVDNPLLGDNGAARVYAGQKGATDDEIDILELGFNKIANLMQKKKLVSSIEGLSGAGGGLAAGIAAFFKGRIIQSREFIRSYLLEGINKAEIDYVITGEGSFDFQSKSQKGAGIIIDEFKDSAQKIFLVCGKISKAEIEKYGNKVIPVPLISFFKNEKNSINNFEKGIMLASQEIIRHLLS